MVKEYHVGIAKFRPAPSDASILSASSRVFARSDGMQANPIRAQQDDTEPQRTKLRLLARRATRQSFTSQRHAPAPTPSCHQTAGYRSDHPWRHCQLRINAPSSSAFLKHVLTRRQNPRRQRGLDARSRVGEQERTGLPQPNFHHAVVFANARGPTTAINRFPSLAGGPRRVLASHRTGGHISHSRAAVGHEDTNRLQRRALRSANQSQARWHGLSDQDWR